jgi:DNA-binding response OmpR family regulator
LGERAKVVAVMAANPALSSILAVVLAASPGIRVRSFQSVAELTTYMHLAPVDVAVLDFEHAEAPADRVSFDLRHDNDHVEHDFSVIALTRRVSAATRRVAVASGIDEVIVKPMSPRYLLERVEARLRRHIAAPMPAAAVVLRADNVVPLFPAE